MDEGIGKARAGGAEEAVPPEGADRQQKELQRVPQRPLRLGYNPITGAYEESNRGQALKNYDEGKEVNRYVRAKNMVEKNNTNFNIITGEQKPIVDQPIPERIRGRVEQKYEQKKEREAVKYVPQRDKYDYLDD